MTAVQPIANPYTNRARPLESLDLPAIVIETSAETSELSTKENEAGDALIFRTLTAALTMVLANDDQDLLDNAMDDMAVRIEAAMATDFGIAHRVEPTGFVSEFESDGDTWFGFATLTYAIEYFTVEGKPEIAQ